MCAAKLELLFPRPCVWHQHRPVYSDQRIQTDERVHLSHPACSWYYLFISLSRCELKITPELCRYRLHIITPLMSFFFSYFLSRTNSGISVSVIHDLRIISSFDPKQYRPVPIQSENPGFILFHSQNWSQISSFWHAGCKSYLFKLYLKSWDFISLMLKGIVHPPQKNTFNVLLHLMTLNIWQQFLICIYLLCVCVCVCVCVSVYIYIYIYIHCVYINVIIFKLVCVY